jgi:transposase
MRTSDCAMDRQTLRDWVHRYNGDGVEGLSDQPRRIGPKPRLSAEQQAVVADWVDQAQLSYCCAFGGMRAAEFRAFAMWLSICGAK